MGVICVVLALLAAVSCATRATLETHLASLVGQNANELSKEFGYPIGTTVAPNGNKVYIYERRKSYISPPSYQTYGTGKDRVTVETEGQVVESWCKIYIEVGHENKVVRWHLEGNACRE